MPKDFFRFDDMTPLSAVPAGGRIHFIGVCGVAMGQLAVALADKGYVVSGSDKEFYEPMGSFLSNSSVEIHKGYAASNIPVGTSLVVIGNAISYEHEEVAAVEQQGLPYTCFPRLLRETVISDKTSIVVCGTHGKSTTTSMITSTLKRAGSDPSYFIGAVSEDLGKSLYSGSPDISVVEGDEYDDVFFSKKAKFLHYDPTICIINAVEFDHADLYPDLSSIDAAFTRLVMSLPKDAYVLCCFDDDHLRELVATWKQSASCKFLTFGFEQGADCRITSCQQSGLTQEFIFESQEFGKHTVRLSVAGSYNARNALATILSCHLAGVSFERIITELADYRLVKRRQEVRLDHGGVMVIEDFAHHPTAVALTIQLVREAFPDKTLWAIFEPRSNTSRRKVFQDDYIRGFQLADKAIISGITVRGIDEGQELLDIQTLSEKIREQGTDCITLPGAGAIAAHLLEQAGKNDVVLVMSNGSFDGLIDRLVSGFRARP